LKISDLQKKAFQAQNQISKQYIKIPGMKERFEIIEISFDILELFLTIPFRKNETLAVAFREIVLRSHRTLQAVTLNATAGLEIPTMSFLRDLIEIEFLLRYFLINPSEVPKWWQASRETRLRKYSPSKLRAGISKKFPKLKKPMEDDYFGHCEIASHPTPESLKLQSEFKDNPLLLPSKDLTFVWICLMEVSFHAQRVAELVADLGYTIYPQTDMEKKLKKLQKLSLNLPATRKIGVLLLRDKFARSKKK